MDQNGGTQDFLSEIAHATWIACNPQTTSPADVEELGILAIRDLNAAIENGDYMMATVANAIVSTVHRAMVCRGMFLDATDLFCRVNATAKSIGIDDMLDGQTYTEYVEAILDWYAQA
jgi:hypothetical protein